MSHINKHEYELIGIKRLNKSIFNKDNTHYKDGKYPLFCGQQMALLDKINSPYPELMAFYEKQMAQGWKWDEVSLTQDRQDMLTAPKEIVDLMVDTIMYQWSIDSVAANSILPLFAPFISSPELAALFTEITRMEIIHSFTYPHIIQQTMDKPKEALYEAMKFKESLERGDKIIKVFDNLAKVGGLVRAGLLAVDSQEAREAVLLGMVNLYILEQISFMSSFAVTFAISELGIFQGIGALVSLIARDEHSTHAAADKYIVKKLKQQMPEEWDKLHEQMIDLVDEAVKIELSWNEYLFTNRSCVGLTKTLLDDWVRYMSSDIYRTLGIDVYEMDNPLPYMESYLDLDSVQAAAQETTLVNYQLDSVEDDLGEEELEW